MKKIIVLLLVGLAFTESCSNGDALNNGSANTVSMNQQTLGSSSKDLLSDKKYTSMVIEVAYVVGYEPSVTAINNFVAFIGARTFKPNGISIVKRELPSPGFASYTNPQFIALEDANRTKYNTSNQIAVWVFFADGKSAGDTSTTLILGESYRNTSFIIFENTVQRLSTSSMQPSRSLLETTVITHEFGHILGLVNLGAPMQTNHEDTAHPNHCTVQNCLMYWLSESGNSLANLGSAPQLDAQCIADLQANGGK